MTEQDNFQIWLMSIDDELVQFFENIPNQLKPRLDYSVKSLIDLEGYILTKFKSIDNLMSNKIIHNQIAIYIGETFRKNLNAKWKILTDDPKFAFYGLPIIVQSNNGVPFCPLTLATTIIDRDKGNFIYQILTNQLK